MGEQRLSFRIIRPSLSVQDELASEARATARKLLYTFFYTLKNHWVFEDFSYFKFTPCN
jgi:hypothetical protein